MFLTLILLSIGATILFMALRSLRAQRLKERYVLLFFFVASPFLALAVWPDTIGIIASKLDIQYQTVVLLGVTTFFLLLNFKLLSIVSSQERRIATLAQIIGLQTQGQAGKDWQGTWPGQAADQAEES